MKTPPLPDNPHDLALWLFTQLESPVRVGAGVWEGVLPKDLNFPSVVQQLESVAGSLSGVNNETARTIEFYPSSANVYESLDEFFSHPANLRVIPNRFTIRELNYTHGGLGDIPEKIAHYLAAATLCDLLTRVADHATNNGVSQHFIKSHDSKIEVRLNYNPQELVPLPSLDLFASEYVTSTHHKDQKRDIVRSALIEIFKGKRQVSLGDFLPRFEEFMDNVRSSYVMFTADFSYEKIRLEVDKQNLEDTLRLNKIVSDIQNQLLALPAALVLAGAGIQNNQNLKNLSIWIGICIFSWMMRTLVTNQRHSIDAVDGEICSRQNKLAVQPDDVSKRFSDAFVALKTRVADQKKVLQGIYLAVKVIWLVVTVMILTVFFPECSQAIWSNFVKLGTWITSSASEILHRFGL